MKYLIVENRKNDTLRICLNSAHRVGVDVSVIDETDAGECYAEFSNVYVHNSTNSSEFELICFRRYFLLLNYAEKEGLDEFVLLDSDVMVFDGIDEYIKLVSKDKEFVGSYVASESDVHKRISPHISYWRLDALRSFVSFLIKSYRDILFLDDLSDIFRSVKQAGALGGVSDMTLIYFWARSNGYLSSSTAKISGYAADHNITSSDNGTKNEYQSLFGVKIVLVRQGFPYVKAKSGEQIKFVLLHFQGQAKRLMPLFSSGKYLTFTCGLIGLGFAKSIRRIFFRVFK